MPFTKQTLEFISENYMRNDRQWFKDHKADYESLVLAPFSELLQNYVKSDLSDLTAEEDADMLEGEYACSAAEKED